MTSPQGQTSPGYNIVLEKVRNEIERMDSVRTRSRCFSLYGVQKATGEPHTSEGLERTRSMTEKALDSLVKDGTIVSYTIHPRFEGGPEWAFIELHRRYKPHHGTAAA